MQRLKSVPPPEAPANPDPVERLVEALLGEGFVPVEEERSKYGERIFQRREKVLFAEGDTIFLLIDYPELSEKVVRQATEGITKLFRAQRRRDKALAVLQTTTVYVGLIARGDVPHGESLNRFVSTVGGAITIPVVLVPEINQVVYPSIEERVSTVRPRLEYLQYLLGERQQRVDLHRQTIQTFYISAGLLGVLLLGVLFTLIT